ncbi:DUF2235 domain-containing protein [Amycolatopsis sp. K13G38]|uniref:DUF2235 domain-containing protein n=1 Tax=Amycolatopsis acididurans TaxID=2724524 RepID=A0ABX1IVD0_9PSEU|nr:DUF2235 domain-containing protein [Amycolatopsis acididurans]NKQ51443.1 DUF2235 domain-containing protein [Amycolatopsis acididurans]
MGKRLVICCDGTWNTWKQPAPTNVVKVSEAVAPMDEHAVLQLGYYHAGVGTRPWDRVLGGAFGFGLSRNVRACYRFLVRHFEPGDEVFLFGFSRGAYTARSTAGFIRNCGILARHNEDRIAEAYRLYRDRDPATGPDSPRAREFRARYAHEDVTPIRFIGVWDTVGALGIPLSGGRLINLVNRRWQFHDTQLSSTIRSAFQALAIDEKRRPFTPAVWKPSPAADGQQREQVWFTGVHSDVGGGYPQTALSDLTLRWMTARARACGLAFTEDAFAGLPARDEFGPLHDSATWFYRMIGTTPRKLGEQDAPSEYAASSAADRQKEMNPPYRAENLRTYLADAAHQIMPV